MNSSQIDWLLLGIQTLMLAMTAVIIPIRMQRRLSQYLIYTVVSAGLWFAYAIVTVQFDAINGIDVPGFGYIGLGVISWIVGSIVYAIKLRKMQTRKIGAEQNL